MTPATAITAGSGTRRRETMAASAPSAIAPAGTSTIARLPSTSAALARKRIQRPASRSKVLRMSFQALRAMIAITAPPIP